jgi:hypothetical protein
MYYILQKIQFCLTFQNKLLNIPQLNKLRSIFILLISLLSINGVMVNDVSINEISTKSEVRLLKKTYQVSVDNFVEDSTPNEDFDLEEDTDDTDDDFLETMFSRNLVIIGKSFQNHSFSYTFSHQSVKRFILYCSLKLHC